VPSTKQTQLHGLSGVNPAEGPCSRRQTNYTGLRPSLVSFGLTAPAREAVKTKKGNDANNCCYSLSLAKIGSGIVRISSMIHLQYHGKYATARREFIAS
jgi:hypothetical protein